VLAVDCPGEHLRSRCFRHHERLAGEIRLVHHPVALDNDAVNRADFMRINDQLVVDADIG
jgi:hypothetical protein